MTHEQEDLLLKDLCARFKYGVIVVTPKGRGYVNDINFTIFGCELGVNIDPLIRDTFSINDVKPYLFPMSSMTDCQKSDYQFITERWMNDPSHSISDSIDWLNKNHFDYRGLIEKGLAIDATKLSIY